MSNPDLYNDSVKLIDNATVAEFRVTNAPARLAVSGAGTIKSWQGNAFDAGEAITGTTVINAPGRYELTLDATGYATLQES